MLLSRLCLSIFTGRSEIPSDVPLMPFIYPYEKELIDELARALVLVVFLLLD